MANAYTRNLSTPTPQTQRANERQVKNNAGGYVYEVSPETRLDRFLILGTDKGTYYQNEAEITKQNTDFVVNLIKSDPMMVLNRAVEISDSGRAYKNSPAIFALALVFKHGSDEAKAEAKAAVRKICRTATHLFELAEYFELLGGWSRARRSAIADWYTQKTPDQLAYQAVKYRQRNGWTHKDLFYLAHPWVSDKNVANFILGNLDKVEVPQGNVIYGFLSAQSATDKRSVLSVLDKHKNLPWEALPTQFHKEPEVWKKLFYNGQLKGQALVRNITRLARIGAFNDMVFAADYAQRLQDAEQIKASRLHPLNFLNAIVVHEEGQIQRRDTGFGMYAGGRKKDWSTVPVIMDALNEAFYKSFDFVEPTGKRTFLALDVSGSMGSTVNGLDLSCAQVSGAMAMTVARTEPYYMVRGFTGGYRFARGGSFQLSDLGISPKMDLNTVMRKMHDNNFGTTDCSAPMEYAIAMKLEIDTFVVFTDSETYQGKRHADEALRDYRRKSGIDAKLIVAGMTATDFTIADPQDAGMMDIVGADANLPRLVADFSAGRL